MNRKFVVDRCEVNTFTYQVNIKNWISDKFIKVLRQIF